MSRPTAYASACDGESYHDLCAAPATCSLCSLWPASNETRDGWKARMRAAWDAGGETCRNGHPWAANERINTQGYRVCTACNRAWCAKNRAKRKDSAA